MYVAINNFKTKMCHYIISSEQSDLLAIFENFSDKISEPEDNIFFIQNEILDKILTNVEHCKKDTISIQEIYKGISKEDKESLRSIDLDNKLIINTQFSKILGIEYFDKDVFMRVLDNKLESIATNYNLNAYDDHNKLYMFLSAIQLSLQSSDDILASLTNQYIFYKEHANTSSKEKKDEFITIYGEKHYKIDILKKLIEEYNTTLNDKQGKNKTKGTKRK
jgi:hypothetical protein